MTEPLFWLSMSLTLVSVSLTAVLIAAVPALRELGRAARSAEKLFDVLNREFPPTLEAIRLTGLEISELTDELNQGVQGVGNVGKSLERGAIAAQGGLQQAQGGTRKLMAGFKAAWHSWQTYPDQPISTVDSKHFPKN